MHNIFAVEIDQTLNIVRRTNMRHAKTKNYTHITKTVTNLNYK